MKGDRGDRTCLLPPPLRDRVLHAVRSHSYSASSVPCVARRAKVKGWTEKELPCYPKHLPVQCSTHLVLLDVVSNHAPQCRHFKAVACATCNTLQPALELYSLDGCRCRRLSIPVPLSLAYILLWLQSPAMM
eukprot:2430959-Pyramimonas_sp.AAC.1